MPSSSATNRPPASADSQRNARAGGLGGGPQGSVERLEDERRQMVRERNRRVAGGNTEAVPVLRHILEVAHPLAFVVPVTCSGRGGRDHPHEQQRERDGGVDHAAPPGGGNRADQQQPTQTESKKRLQRRQPEERPDDRGRNLESIPIDASRAVDDRRLHNQGDVGARGVFEQVRPGTVLVKCAVDERSLALEFGLRWTASISSAQRMRTVGSATGNTQRAVSTRPTVNRGIPSQAPGCGRARPTRSTSAPRLYMPQMIAERAYRQDATGERRRSAPPQRRSHATGRSPWSTRVAAFHRTPWRPHVVQLGVLRQAVRQPRTRVRNHWERTRDGWRRSFFRYEFSRSIAKIESQSCPGQRLYCSFDMIAHGDSRESATLDGGSRLETRRKMGLRQRIHAYVVALGRVGVGTALLIAMSCGGGT